MDITLSELICNARDINPDVGDILGNCIFCGRYTYAGFPAKLKENFTAYEYLQSGEVLCPQCYHMYNENEYRKSMWYVTQDTFQKIKRDNVKSLLLSPPEPPFAIYLTKTYKKQGWISLMNRVNFNRNSFILGFDYDVITVTPKIHEYNDAIEKLVEQKVTKQELLTGHFKPHRYDKIDHGIIRTVQKNIGNPLWEVCIWMN